MVSLEVVLLKKGKSVLNAISLDGFNVRVHCYFELNCLDSFFLILRVFDLLDFKEHVELFS